MSYGVLACDIVVTELHAYDFVIKERCYLYRTLYIFKLKYVIYIEAQVLRI